MTLCSFERSRQRIAEASRLIPGGVSSHFRFGVSPTPLVIERADGVYLYDADGNRLIDYYLALGPMILGHTPVDVIEAARAQLERGILYGGQSELEFDAARLVCEMVPCAERVRFASSGSEAVQLALRLARATTGRKTVLKFEGHYHGWLDSVLWSVGTPPDDLGPEAQPIPFAGSSGQDPMAGAHVEVLSWNRTEQVVERLARGDVAAVIMEPMMCNSGGILPLPGYLEAVRKACTDSGTVLIFDEVITGFRVGPGGAQQRLGVTPDLAIFAKAIANGFSVAAVAGQARFMDQLAHGGIIHGGTYNAQSIAMAATIATLKRLNTPGVFEMMEERGQRLMTGLSDALKEAGIPATVRGLPQIFSVALGLKTPPVNYRDTLATDRKRYIRLTTAMLERGVRALERGAWFLSTEHDDEIIATTIAAFREALATIRT
ncbi:MAG TPA: aspartate aminotransferase family protein [Geminicoccus sp.]|jgi:glutamate-1-semialdehyde 2,1-aminomutase|uniref:aspartate aminotransferase family protein n=1 Tax=Geminicoccus sp. TaxID=2024832 RepID=UPI002E358F97|nr:aspartate aminotransferase family protein [Geminicoccus sp.]HEX2527610.1 aspartate aminotransferase family protein [Geminicoccus sp.]